MWGKQVNLYITWIIWSRVIACYEDNVCVLFQLNQQNNKITLIAALIEKLTGPWMHFLTLSVFLQKDKSQSNELFFSLPPICKTQTYWTCKLCKNFCQALVHSPKVKTKRTWWGSPTYLKKKFINQREIGDSTSVINWKPYVLACEQQQPKI